MSGSESVSMNRRKMNLFLRVREDVSQIDSVASLVSSVLAQVLRTDGG